MFRFLKNLVSRLGSVRSGAASRRNVPSGLPVHADAAYRVPVHAFPLRQVPAGAVRGSTGDDADDIVLPVPRRPMDDWLLG